MLRLKDEDEIIFEALLAENLIKDEDDIKFISPYCDYNFRYLVMLTNGEAYEVITR